MNGVHDMGGMDGFGKVEPEPNEPVFHEEWEGRVLAMVRAMGAAGAFNIDTSRFYRETLPPHVYLASSYYKKWFLGLEDMLIDKGFITRRKSRPATRCSPRRRSSTASCARRRRAHHGARQVRPPCSRRRRNSRPATACAPRTSIPATHTRLPRYVRGHVGVVERNHGCHVFPDSAAMELGENPQWLYTVVFEGRDLWGADGDPTLKVSIDAFEPYLDPA